MKQLTIGDRTYQVGRLNVFKQLKIGRRLAPLQLQFINSAVPGESELDIDRNLFAASVVATLMQLPDVDFELITNECLNVVQVQQEKGWADLKSLSGVLMFDDINPTTILKLTLAVIEENLGSFFPTAAPSSPSAQK